VPLPKADIGTAAGNNFAGSLGTATALLGGVSCPIQSRTHQTIVCTLPALPLGANATDLPVIVSINGRWSAPGAALRVSRCSEETRALGQGLRPSATTRPTSRT
jgi:hypothetical protein